jgi:glycosyltransferase involved in cell wall biosynthesis
MRALVVTNMYPSPERPAFGRFVADQVQALRGIAGVEVDVFSFDGGGISAYAAAARELRRRYGAGSFDIVHAHFGLTAWPALAARTLAGARVVTLHGTDLAHPRSRPLTLAALPLYDLVAVVSDELAQRVPAWAARRPPTVLPCGVDLERFDRIDRRAARRELGLAPEAPCLLFAADPKRPEKRHDLARAAAEGTPLLTLGDVAPDRVPLFVNAANAVLVPSDREGFGLAVLEALACDVPVLATPHGVAPDALAGVDGTLCAPFDVVRWRAALRPILADPDPRIDGRGRAARWSAVAMAERVAATWQGLLRDARPG